MRCEAPGTEKEEPDMIQKVIRGRDSIRQAEEMAGQIRRTFGDVCSIYHSRLCAEARKRSLMEFRENRHRILVSCRCLDEGIGKQAFLAV